MCGCDTGGRTVGWVAKGEQAQKVTNSYYGDTRKLPPLPYGSMVPCQWDGIRSALNLAGWLVGPQQLTLPCWSIRDRFRISFFCVFLCGRAEFLCYFAMVCLYGTSSSCPVLPQMVEITEDANNDTQQDERDSFWERLKEKKKKQISHRHTYFVIL